MSCGIIDMKISLTISSNSEYGFLCMVTLIGSRDIETFSNTYFIRTRNHNCYNISGQ